MEKAREFYRQLNNENGIKEHDGIPSWTPDDMIWFAEEYYKSRSDKWILVTEADFTDLLDDKVIINWVNIEHEKPYFGMSIIEIEAFSYESYKRNYGRTVYAWKPYIVEHIILPDDIKSEEDLFDYLRASNQSLNL